MKLIFKSLLILCAFFSLNAFAEAQDDKRSAEQLRKLLDAMSTLQGKFTQTLYDNKGEELEQSSGTFVLQRPGKFYWKTEQPYPQLLVSDHQTIWLYDPDLEQVTVRPVGDDLQQTPALLLSESVEKLRASFTITRQAEKNQPERFTLTPKDPKGLFQQLTLVFVNAQLQEFHLQDNLGQLTHFALREVEGNQKVDDTLFHFTPPPGVDVLHD
jgi:outer membrane lipoprotein carrier protein